MSKSNLTQGSSLQVESLEVVLKQVTFNDSNLRMWKQLMGIDPLEKYPEHYRDLVNLLHKLGVAKDI